MARDSAAIEKYKAIKAQIEKFSQPVKAVEAPVKTQDQNVEGIEVHFGPATVANGDTLTLNYTVAQPGTYDHAVLYRQGMTTQSNTTMTEALKDEFSDRSQQLAKENIALVRKNQDLEYNLNVAQELLAALAERFGDGKLTVLDSEREWPDTPKVILKDAEGGTEIHVIPDWVQVGDDEKDDKPVATGGSLVPNWLEDTGQIDATSFGNIAKTYLSGTYHASSPLGFIHEARAKNKPKLQGKDGAMYIDGRDGKAIKIATKTEWSLTFKDPK